jgi:hypothetical protein
VRGFLAKKPSSSSPHGLEQREGEGGGALEGGGAGGPSRGGGRGVEQYGEGDEGISSPCSP